MLWVLMRIPIIGRRATGGSTSRLLPAVICLHVDSFPACEKALQYEDEWVCRPVVLKIAGYTVRHRLKSHDFLGIHAPA
jgi:hypothetical protein